MIKKELLAMRDLRATSKMMGLAAADILRKEAVGNGSWSYTYERCQYRLFMRSIVQDGILKVSLFLPKSMRLGARKAAFDVFINREARAFLTYDRERQRWLTGKLDRIKWEKDQYRGTELWISPADANTVKEYLCCDVGGYQDILNYQRGIRDDALLLRYKKQTDPWDADLAQIRPLPKDWDRWVSKVGIPQHFIFYQYKKNGAGTCYCTYCEKDVPIRQPRHNRVVICCCCRHSVTLKAIGRAGTVWTDLVPIYLPQRFADGIVIREFRARMTYLKGAVRSPQKTCYEIGRTIYDACGKPLRAYYWGFYKQKFSRWIKGSVCSPYHYGDAGRVYRKTLPDLSRRGLSRSGLIEYVQQEFTVDPDKYLSVLQRVPQIEQVVKARLSKLTNECISSYYLLPDILADKEATSLTKMFGINAQELKRLRASNGGASFLAWLRYEKIAGKDIPDPVILWFCKNNVQADDLKFIRRRMSMAQICRYMQRQMEEGHMKSQEMLTTWADYLSMAARFQMDVNDELVYRPGRLRQRHDELAARGMGKDIAVQAGEILLKYPNVETICRSLEAKYGYRNKEYVIMAPTCIEDVLLEGQHLHHCIANSERYWERIERHESYLLFLRKVRTPDRHYYTMEVEPDGTVRQLRTYLNCRNKDADKAKPFLLEWQKVVAERLTETDRQMADKSRVLREQEFVQLRKDQVIIRTGHLAGQLLVDVLTADVMENAA